MTNVVRLKGKDPTPENILLDLLDDIQQNRDGSKGSKVKSVVTIATFENGSVFVSWSEQLKSELSHKLIALAKEVMTENVDGD